MGTKPSNPRATAPGRTSLANYSKRTERKTLVLVSRKRRGHDRDFPKLAACIKQIAPDISPLVVRDHLHNSLRSKIVFRPTLTVSFSQLRRLRPVRGAVCQNRLLPKSEEYRRLQSVGIPVPDWQLIDRSLPPQLDSFEDYVVVKPDLGARGAEVKIKRKSRVRWKPPTTARAIQSGLDQLLVQQFIYTGAWPVSYRVTVLFGRVLFAWRVEASRDRRPLPGPSAFREGAQGGGVSIASSGRDCRFTLCYEPEILELAQRAHAAFRDFPLLGIDIVRDAITRQLYVIEVNSCGSVWHFSSDTGQSIQRENQIDFANQFQGIQVAAESLVHEVRKRAA